MEYIEGKEFEKILEEKGLMPPLDAIKLFIPVLEAMAFAHKNGIIHRDIKPSNMMILNSGGIKILDFGTAKVGGASQLTAAGMTLGTVVYMSPEQLMGRDITPQADVYSLGVMLYRMLAGKPPFSAPGTGELMAMHIYMQPPPLQGVNPALPDTLVALVHRMLAKNRVERPSMGQVAQELGRNWKALTDEERRFYEKKAQDDKVRYAEDMQTYKTTGTKPMGPGAAVRPKVTPIGVGGIGGMMGAGAAAIVGDVGGGIGHDDEMDDEDEEDEGDE